MNRGKAQQKHPINIIFQLSGPVIGNIGVLMRGIQQRHIIFLPDKYFIYDQDTTSNRRRGPGIGDDDTDKSQYL